MVSQFQIPSICHASQVSLQPGPCLPHSRLFGPVSGSRVTRVSFNTFTPAPLQSPSSLAPSLQVPCDPATLEAPPPQPGPHVAPWFCLPENWLLASPPPHAPRAPLPAPPCTLSSPSPPLHPEVAARLTNPSACFRGPRAENLQGTRAQPGVLGLTCVCMLSISVWTPDPPCGPPSLLWTPWPPVDSLAPLVDSLAPRGPPSPLVDTRSPLWTLAPRCGPRPPLWTPVPVEGQCRCAGSLGWAALLAAISLLVEDPATWLRPPRFSLLKDPTVCCRGAWGVEQGPGFGGEARPTPDLRVGYASLLCWDGRDGPPVFPPLPVSGLRVLQPRNGHLGHTGGCGALVGCALQLRGWGLRVERQVRSEPWATVPQAGFAQHSLPGGRSLYRAGACPACPLRGLTLVSRPWGCNLELSIMG